MTRSPHLSLSSMVFVPQSRMEAGSTPRGNLMSKKSKCPLDLVLSSETDKAV